MSRVSDAPGKTPMRAGRDRIAWCGLLGGLLFAGLFFLKALPGRPPQLPLAAAPFAATGPTPRAVASQAQGQSFPLSDVKARAAEPVKPRRTKSIEDIVAGDVLLAKDAETGKLAPKRVVRVFRRTVNHLRIVRIHSPDGSSVQEVRTTDEHPFWVDGYGWVKAGELQVGQKVVQPDGQRATVAAAVYEPHPQGFSVFNLEVEGYHTYFVAARRGAGPILVHNNNNCSAFDPGVRGTIDPTGDNIIFREPILRGPDVDAYRPFDQTLSDTGGQPIRVVAEPNGNTNIMQGNHRIQGAREDGVQSVGGIIYTPDQWTELTGGPFVPGGTNNPTIIP